MSRYNLTLTGPDGATLDMKVPSVTEIIDEVLAKNGLPDWYYKQAVLGFGALLTKYGTGLLTADVKSLHSLMKQDGYSPYAVRDSAAGIGNRVHRDVSALAKGRRPDNFPNLTTWWKEKGFRAANILGTEALLYSGKHGYAGTADLVYTEPLRNAGPGTTSHGGETVLADVKTGKFRDSHRIQLELYRWAWEEMGRERIDRMQLIQVPRDGSEVKVEEVPISDALTRGAQGLLTAYQWRTQTTKSV